MLHWLFDASNSLVSQSRSATMRNDPINGDGFGVGWYPTHDDPQPGYFVSIEPAWSNRNLRQIATKIYTGHFFAHVRDATEGLAVSQNNCHPFKFADMLWMHNGQLDQFEAIRRKVMEQLSDQAFSFIQGNTDSEYAFALFLDQLNFCSEATTSQMKAAMLATMEKIMRFRIDAGVNTNSYMNFAVTNKKVTLFTRFATEEGVRPASLFYYQGPNKGGPLIVASEPLCLTRENWTKVERNQMVCIENQTHLSVEDMKLPFQVDL
jgi:glutamine amidotransferase